MPGQLKNERHEAFAFEVFKGMPKGIDPIDIYRKLYPKVSKQSAPAAASRLLKIVKDRLQELKTSVYGKALLTMTERREWLARTVRANIKHLDLSVDGDLPEEITEENGKTRIKLASKRACIMDDARLAGDLIEKIDHTTDGQPLPSVAPQITIEVSPHWNKPRTGA